jgi:hypothetical protein
MASESDSLESIFGNVAPAASASAPAEPAPAPAAEQTGEVASATTAQAQPDASATPAQDEGDLELVVRDGGKYVPLPAVLKERKQRQERLSTAEKTLAERDRELAELRGQLSVYSTQRNPQAPANQQEPVDPDLEVLTNPSRAIDSRIDKVTAQVNDRLMRMSAAAMRAQHTDFDEAAQAFVKAAAANPALEAACVNSDNPALFAYQNGKTYLEVMKYGGSLEKMRETIRKEEEAKAEAKYRKQGALDAAAQASTSTAGARSVGSNAPAFAGPPKLDELFPGTLQ